MLIFSSVSQSHLARLLIRWQLLQLPGVSHATLGQPHSPNRDCLVHLRDYNMEPLENKCIRSDDGAFSCCDCIWRPSLVQNVEKNRDLYSRYMTNREEYRKEYHTRPELEPPRLDYSKFKAPMQAIVENVIRVHGVLYIIFRCKLVVPDADLGWLLPYKKSRSSKKQAARHNFFVRKTTMYVVSCGGSLLPERVSSPPTQDFGYAKLNLDTRYDRVRCITEKKAREADGIRLYDIQKNADSVWNALHFDQRDHQTTSSITITTDIGIESSSSPICLDIPLQDPSLANSPLGALDTVTVSMPQLLADPLQEWPELTIPVEEALYEAERMDQLQALKRAPRRYEQGSNNVDSWPQAMRLVSSSPDAYGLGVTRVLKETGPTGQLEYRPTTDFEASLVAQAHKKEQQSTLKACLTFPAAVYDSFHDVEPQSYELNAQIRAIYGEAQPSRLEKDT